ncbi:MAG: 3-isopropylmalate dehydratase small subunit [Gammaproteobacteria bacterium]|nr:3-isopropylmalate dehydratase small subunit [Gammaproteobacteria bacterium]
MQPFRCHRGIAAPLLQANIDTDAIIPSREMRQVSRKGLSSGLFSNWRYTDAAARHPDPLFVLNRPAYANATILLCGSNFGCGSSREFAVWALAEFGIRVIVAPSFGAIFQKNCIANGVLSAIVPDAAVKELARWVEDDPPSRLLTVDLATGLIGSGLGETPFEIAEADRARLLRGVDPVTHTLTHADAIRAFEKQRFEKHPWARVSLAADGKIRTG